MSGVKANYSPILKDAVEVGKVFCIILFLSFLFSPLPSKTRDRLVYLGLLAIPPAMMFSNFSFTPNRKWAKKESSAASSTAIALPVVLLALTRGSWQSLLVSMLLAGTQLFLLKNIPLDRKERFYRFTFLTTAWLIAGKLAYWIKNYYGAVVLGNASTFVTAFALVAIFTLSLKGEILARDRQSTKSQYLKKILWLILTSVLILLLVKVPEGVTSAHHWSFYTGPAELLRAKGWLLHDVPSQYGLLNIALLAFLPGADSYVNLHIIQIIFYVILSTIFFAVWMKVFTTTLGRILAVPSILTLIYFCPGWLEGLSGPLACPSVGPFRFLFAEVLLGIVLFSDTKPKKQLLGEKNWLLLGHLMWLLGAFWSAESAIYCTLTWFPSYLVLTWDTSQKNFLSQLFRLLTLPIATFLAIIITISTYYKISLGHFPDWPAYFEFALAYSNGFGSLPASPAGTVWFIALEFAALVGFFLNAISDQSPRWRIAVSTASLFLFWSTLSYFATRSHENNTLNLVPIHALCLLVNVATISNPFQEKHILRWAYFLPMIIIPLCIVITSPIQLGTLFENNWSAMLSGNAGFPSIGHPELPIEAQNLLQSSTFRPKDPIAFLGHYLLILPRETPRVAKTWLPLAPAVQMAILPPERQAVYFKRWLTRLKPTSGYLLYSVTESPGDSVRRLIGRNGYQPIKTWQIGDWVLINYELRG